MYRWHTEENISRQVSMGLKFDITLIGSKRNSEENNRVKKKDKLQLVKYETWTKAKSCQEIHLELW